MTAQIAFNATETQTKPVPVSETRATFSKQAISSCFERSSPQGCATTGTYAASTIIKSDRPALPSWITWNHGSSILTVAPNSPSYAGTMTLKEAYTPAYGTAAQFAMETLTIECIVAHD